MRSNITSTRSSSGPAGSSVAGYYVGGSTVGKVMRDLALSMIKGEPITIDAKTYGPNEYVYGKDVGLALFLACQAQNPKQRIYNAGSGVVTGAEELAQVVRELAPQTEVKVSGASSGRQKPQHSDGHQRLKSRARLRAAVSAKRSPARLHGRVVGGQAHRTLMQERSMLRAIGRICQE